MLTRNCTGLFSDWLLPLIADLKLIFIVTLNIFQGKHIFSKVTSKHCDMRSIACIIYMCFRPTSVQKRAQIQGAYKIFNN